MKMKDLYAKIVDERCGQWIRIEVQHPFNG